MMNLLPQNEKRIVKNEYRARAITVALLAVFVTIVAAVVLLIPSYIIASITERDMQEQKQQLEEAREQETQDATPRHIIEQTNEYISILKEGGDTSVTKDIAQPIASRRQDISITHIQYNRNPEGGSVVRVSGIAPSRNSLQSFADRLEQHSMFDSVNIPVSNFVSAVNIEFSLEITTRK